MQASPPEIFDTDAREMKRRRAARRFADFNFLHQRVAEDVVDRLESILRPFNGALFHGPGAGLIAEALTEDADVSDVTLLGEPGEDGASASPTDLPFPEDNFELVVSLFTLHAVNDIVGAMREAGRVLKPDGLFIAIFPGEQTLMELRDVLRSAEVAATGGLSPRVSPFVAVKDSGALLQAAGFAMPVSDVTRLTLTYRDLSGLVRDLRGMGETSVLREAPKGALRREVFARAAADYAERYPSDDDGIRARMDLLTVTGWKPHPSQPKPLKPGSAKASLAEALKAQAEKDGGAG